MLNIGYKHKEKLRVFLQASEIITEWLDKRINTQIVNLIHILAMLA